MAPLHRSTAPPPPEAAGQLQIQHFTHQHPVQKLFMAFEFNCDGCKIRGHGVRYRCSACDFDLHEHCATAPHRLSSCHVHPHHQIVLVNRPGTSHFCNVCNGFITEGLSYTCEMCEFDVHTLCTQIPCQQGGPTTAFVGQPVMISNQQQQQGVPMTMTPLAAAASFGDYHGVMNSKPVMINHQRYQHQNHHQRQQQQGISTAAFGGYDQKVYNNNNNNNNQAVMINHHHHHQQQQIAAFGGYQNQFSGYHNQPVMINHQQQQLQQQKSNKFANVGKIAASVLMTSLIGVPVNFNSKK